MAVTFDGRPLDSADIVIEAADGHGTPAGGRVENGRYSVRIAPGPKRVMIYASKPSGPPGPDGAVEMRSYLPAAYNTKSTLTADVQADRPNEIDFHLKPKG